MVHSEVLQDLSPADTQAQPNPEHSSTLGHVPSTSHSQETVERRFVDDNPLVSNNTGSSAQQVSQETAPQPVRKSLTIGGVCKTLLQEFPDISISKIRYLEDQKLISPRRTSGGYRVYSPEDIARLRTVLRLQRDEFLPLRVIRQELAAGASPAQIGNAVKRYNSGVATRQRTTVQDRGVRHALEDVLTETGATRKLIEELEDFGIVNGENRAGVRYYDDAEREIIVAANELARYGVAGRNLRIFRTSVEREGALLQQILAPALRSRNPERRKEALEALENLVSVATHMKHLLLIRDLRKLTGVS